MHGLRLPGATARTERKRGRTAAPRSALRASRVLVTRDFSLTGETPRVRLRPAPTRVRTSFRTRPEDERIAVLQEGGSLVKGITPIERAIAGEPSDRRRRYEHRLAAKGIKRIALNVRAEHVPFFHKLAALSRLDAADRDGAWESIMAEPLDFMRDISDDLVGKR